MRNQERTYSACPILGDEQIECYLNSGELPRGVCYMAVPQSKVVRKRGFWLRPNHRTHHTAMLFLISTDMHAMNVDDLAEQRDQIYCYRSPNSGTAYLGRVDEVESRRKVLSPLIEGLHQPFDIQAPGLVNVGRVISAV